MNNFKILKKVLLYITVLVFVFKSTLVYKKEVDKLKYTYDVPEKVKFAIKSWVGLLKEKNVWNEEYQRRLDKIEWKVLSGHLMEGDNSHPLAYTLFKNVGKEKYEAYEIVLSEDIMFESLGTAFVVYHELGHAILGLDDITEKDADFDFQIMWYKGLFTYSVFAEKDLLRKKVIEQIDSALK